MMGGAWAIAAIGPPLAEWLLERRGMTQSFLIVAGLLAASGLLGVPLASDLIRSAAERDRPGDSSR